VVHSTQQEGCLNYERSEDEMVVFASPGCVANNLACWQKKAKVIFCMIPTVESRFFPYFMGYY
jgi:hypothetical protein